MLGARTDTRAHRRRRAPDRIASPLPRRDRVSRASRHTHIHTLAGTTTANIYVSVKVICEKVEKSDIAAIDKKKYLVPADLTVGQFVYVIRKRIKLSPDKAIFIFVNELLPPTAALMSSVYEEHKDEDG